VNAVSFLKLFIKIFFAENAAKVWLNSDKELIYLSTVS